MRKALGLVVVLMVCFGTAAFGEAQTIGPVKPEPAWCGGAWEPPMLREVVRDGKTATETVPGTGGTNFAPCMPITREVRALDGKTSMVVIPTEPSHPVTLVTFQPDPKTGELKGGRVLTEQGADGKPVSKWVEIKPRLLKEK
jgi:hypothetical protein